MKNNPALIRRLLASACLASLSLVAVANVSADTAAPRADHAKVLPLSHTFAKVESHEGTPFVLKLKNDSHDALKLHGKVLLAVVNHAMDKARKLPEQNLAAGETWTVTGLTADDKVIVSADGYADLEIRVPFKL